MSRAADGGGRLLLVPTIKPEMPSSMTSGTAPCPKAMTGVPHAMASIMTRPKGSGQSIGVRSPIAPPRKSDFCCVADLADELDSRLIEERLDLLVEIVGVDPVHLGGDLERDAALTATRIALGRPFSGEMRPRKAR